MFLHALIPNICICGYRFWKWRRFGWYWSDDHVHVWLDGIIYTGIYNGISRNMHETQYTKTSVSSRFSRNIPSIFSLQKMSYLSSHYNTLKWMSGITHFWNDVRKRCSSFDVHGSFTCEFKYSMAIVYGLFNLTIVTMKRPYTISV